MRPADSGPRGSPGPIVIPRCRLPLNPELSPCSPRPPASRPTPTHRRCPPHHAERAFAIIFAWLFSCLPGRYSMPMPGGPTAANPRNRRKKRQEPGPERSRCFSAGTTGRNRGTDRGRGYSVTPSGKRITRPRRGWPQIVGGRRLAQAADGRGSTEHPLTSRPRASRVKVARRPRAAYVRPWRSGVGMRARASHATVRPPVSPPRPTPIVSAICASTGFPSRSRHRHAGSSRPSR